MRKRPMVLAAAAVAAGFAVYGTVFAQNPLPSGYTPSNVVPAGGVTPPPPVRPASEWTPVAPTTGYVPGQPGNVAPAGGYQQMPPANTVPPAGYGNRPRLTTPVMAGSGGVSATGGSVTVPPPSMDLPDPKAPPRSALAPPSVSQDPSTGDSKFVPPPSLDAAKPAPPPLFPMGAPSATDPKMPQIPVPPAGGNPPHPIGPIGPVSPATPLPPIPSAGGTGASVPAPPTIHGPTHETPVAPNIGAMPLAISSAHASNGMPSKITQCVTVDAVCPATVVYGSPFRYELIVKNTSPNGSAPISGVRIEDQLPAGAKYVGSDPPAELNGDRLSWTIGTLEAGTDKRIAVSLVPTEEGELRSRATVSYTGSVDAKTKVTRPRLAVAVTGVEVCKSGEEAIFQIKVTNNGTGPAEKMIVQALLSDGLSHPAGVKLEMPPTTLPAGETKVIPLKVNAVKAGPHTCQVNVLAPGSLDATSKASVNIVEPMLQIAQTGPSKCLVRGAEPVYEITLSNPGTAATDPITLYSVVPEGFEYVQASETATYSAANRAVMWKLAGLAPGGTKGLTLKLRATVAGDGMLRTYAQATPEQPAAGAIPAGGVGSIRAASRMLESKTETTIKAEGVAVVRFDVTALTNPVEVGKEAIYEIRVSNRGTAVATNVQLVAELAQGMAFTGSSGPTQVKAQGQTLIFDALPSVAVKGDTVYQVKVRGTEPGDLRMRVKLICDQDRTPVVKEEGTRFYKE